MTASSNQRRDLEAIIAQRAEAVGGENIEFDYAGETFSMPHPMFADDDWKEVVREAGNDDVVFAREALGREQYDRFRAAGGRAAYIGVLFQQVLSEMQDEGPAGPTRSSTSSASTPTR